jgi:hypothetical protein
MAFTADLNAAREQKLGVEKRILDINKIDGYAPYTLYTLPFLQGKIFSSGLMPRFSQHLHLNISAGKCAAYTHIVEINKCQNKSTWTLRGYDAAEMWRTRKSSFETASTHFSWLKARSLAA